MRIRYFAWLKQRAGLAEEEVDPPPEVTTVATPQGLARRAASGLRRGAGAPGVVRCAVNQEYVPEDAALRSGDEVAFFPPVTGG